MAGQGGSAAKAPKSSAPAVPKVPQSDVYHTLSHLHQRAAYHSALSVLSARQDDAANEVQGQSAESSASGAAAAATARSSVRAAKTLAAKATIRLDVGLKRTSCKGCSTPLLPGLTSQVRIHPSGPHVRVARTECLTCGYARKIPTPPLLGKASASLLRSDVELRKGAKGKRRQAQKADVVMVESTEDAAVASDVAAFDAVQDISMEEAPTKHVAKPTTQRGRRKATRLRALASASTQPNTSTTAPRPSRTDRALKRRLRSFVALGSSKATQTTPPLSARLSKPPHRPKVHQSRKVRAPALPPFFERVQGSGWDKALPSPPALGQGLERGEESDEMKVARALRATRGNHLVAKGLGQGGASELIE